MIRYTLTRPAGFDANFPWKLEVLGCPTDCGNLMWEQFVLGGFTLHFAGLPPRMYNAPTIIRKIEPSARSFGGWSDDLLKGMTPGPRAISPAYSFASCAPATAALPGSAVPTPASSPSTYTFEDAPGFEKNLGDTMDGKIVTGITWATTFEHKLWRKETSSVICSIRVFLTGRFDQTGGDTRRLSDKRVI
jgi:hypothetical protein